MYNGPGRHGPQPDRTGPGQHGAGHVGPRADRAGPLPCCGLRVRPMVQPVGHFPGPCRPFSPIGPGRHIAQQASHVLIYQFFLTKVNFFSQITAYERSSIQFHCFKQNISQFTSYIKEKKHKITTYRKKINGPCRATGRPGRATTVLRAEGAAHGPVRQRAGPPVARKHRTRPCHGPGQI